MIQGRPEATKEIGKKKEKEKHLLNVKLKEENKKEARRSRGCTCFQNQKED